MSADLGRAGFRDRHDAGDRLGQRLLGYRDRSDLLVLGIPRGGVVVAARVAQALRAPLDVLVVRKLGVPFQVELAMGAVTSGGVRVLNHEVIDGAGIERATIDEITERERLEVERRERAYRGDRPPVEVDGRTVILVDDGLATGSTMAAAVLALRARRPAAVVVAVPVAPPTTCQRLEQLVDRLVCIIQPEWFVAVGAWYEDFATTTDDEVRELLRAAYAVANGP